VPITRINPAFSDLKNGTIQEEQIRVSKTKKEMSHLDKTHHLPLFQKAELIYQLVESLVASLPEEDEYIQATKNLMREDAMIKNVPVIPISNETKNGYEAINTFIEQGKNLLYAWIFRCWKIYAIK